MTITLKNKTTTLVTSALLHVTLLLLFSVYFDFLPVSFKLGNEQSQVVTSYIYQDAQTKVSTETQKTVSKMSDAEQQITKQPTSVSDKHGLQKMHQTKKVANHTALTHAASQPPQVASHGQTVSQLVALLHEAIQKAQRYPAAALQMEREGRVTLGFTLFTDGSIDHLRIIKSSGTESLDKAAMAAVHDASPFKNVDKYLEKAGEYNIDVAFELT